MNYWCCQVTSGYNSDAISDHDYENVRVATDTLSSNATSSRHEPRQEEEDEEGYVDDDDNYVILQTMKSTENLNDTSVWEVRKNNY